MSNSLFVAKNSINHDRIGQPPFGIQLPRMYAVTRQKVVFVCPGRKPRMKIISVNSKKYPGQFALIDDDDYAIVSMYNWYIAGGAKGFFYAARKIIRDKKHITVLMHRELLGLKKGDRRCVDHINGNGLDNRRSCNLRLANKQQNACNQQPRKGTSKYKGVSWHKANAKWAAQIMAMGQTMYLGYFDKEIIAAKAYNLAALKYHGIFAYTNEFKVEIEGGDKVGTQNQN